MEKKTSNIGSIPSSGEQILAKSTKGATFLMMTQIFTKMITFILNSLLVRFLSPRIFGITAFLEFILGTVLFFSREAIRLSTLRIKENQESVSETNTYSTGTKHHSHSNNSKDVLTSSNRLSKSPVLQTVVNFAHIPLWIGIPLSIGLISWQYRNVNSYFVGLPFFTWSIFLIWASIIIELLSEPFFIVNQFFLNYGTRSCFESISVTTGCLTNFIVIYAFEKNLLFAIPKEDLEINKEGIAILAFAIGKFAHSITLLLCYYYDYFKNFRAKRLFHMRLVKIHSSSDSTSKVSYYFQADILEHFRKVYFQMCFKHLLTEGDKLVINSLCTVEEQGIYSLLSNYGSLVTRLLFAPIEESLRLFLARLLSVKRNNKNLILSMEVLVNLTKFYLYLSLIIVIFGPINSSFLLQFLIGTKWSTTTLLDTIRIYCFYIPFLAINGIFEAFFQSVASGDQILKQSYLMMVFSGIFLLNCYIFIQYLDLSLDGLILSNIINMILRITYCGWFISKFYKELHTDRGSFVINFKNFGSVSMIGLIMCLFDYWFIGYVKNFQQLFINIFLALSLLIIMIYQERLLIKRYINRGKANEFKDV
ncbi:hypothetical protein TBLA_0A08770 [Henningerozyma blattae CBS 6284]|uniref:Man(5)GlcNAc(2)-PP-dolichol translocation protein RFT1 n=1 Tax=Henningerozyma blattae (strain ATCC 34711 / CBS 6284 / DSM 70876 / NBRC 10599 / NRRL Y-10934 / UCD 77-7) TaxID=1071380 RepID=I2GX14_HENB6|nr:hypothetical protein TBLA_0A08770 [Tetrapisispora blattae CBS 6284]CCH58666.1 hypothetical protein TBLA_0A08770 [Tetrapisispora blattae CBS 6284]